MYKQSNFSRYNKHRLWKQLVAGGLAFTMVMAPVLYDGASIASAASGTGQLKQQQNSSAAATKELSHSPLKYEIKARLDEKKMTLQGKETVVYKNRSNDALKEIVFHTYADANRSADTQPEMFKKTNEQIKQESPERTAQDFLGGIDIKEVHISGKSASFHNQSQALTVKLDQALEPGQSITLQLQFEVKLPYGSQRLSYYKDIINGAHWFPVLSVYDANQHVWDTKPYSTTFESDYYESSDYQVTLNVLDNYTVSMPGKLTEQPAESGRKTVITTADNTREFVFFASPNLKLESVTRDGLTVEFYYFDDRSGKKEQIDQYIDQAFKAIEFFSEKYGKYPYPEFRIVESYVKGVAVEFSRVIQLGLLEENRSAESDSTFIHEIAHQWFHALIGNDSETESFLDEAFADFSMTYFFENSEDKSNGFKAVQLDEGSMDIAIDSSNDTVKDLWDAVYYKKGRQVIYELYRMLGEEKFDQVMQAYFQEFVYKNATIDGLLQVVGEQAGDEARASLAKNLREPGYTLKPEYGMSDEEKDAYMREQFKNIYHGIFQDNTVAPFETMSRLMDKALQGEPLAIVLSDQGSKEAMKQQEELATQLTVYLQMLGAEPTILKDRKDVKSKLETDLAKSNVIVLGRSANNPFVQALKPGIIKQASVINFPWQKMMGGKDQSGAYVIKHPYNQQRLVLHYYWTEEQLNAKSADAFNGRIMQSLSFSSSFYQYYVLDGNGKLSQEKMVKNPISEAFGE